MSYSKNTNQNRNNSIHTEDDWYDQGFDLANDSAQVQDFDFNKTFAIDPLRVQNAQTQLKQSANNIVSSDAKENFDKNNANLNEQTYNKHYNYFNQNNQPPIIVGGEGRLSEKYAVQSTVTEFHPDDGEYTTRANKRTSTLSERDQIFLRTAEARENNEAKRPLSKREEHERIARIRRERVLASEKRKEAARNSLYVQEATSKANLKVIQAEQQSRLDQENAQKQTALKKAKENTKAIQNNASQDVVHDDAFENYANSQATQGSYNSFQDYVSNHNGESVVQAATQQAMDIAHHRTPKYDTGDVSAHNAFLAGESTAPKGHTLQELNAKQPTSNNYIPQPEYIYKDIPTVEYGGDNINSPSNKFYQPLPPGEKQQKQTKMHYQPVFDKSQKNQAPEQSPTAAPTKENNANTQPKRSNHEKSLEELALEHPDMSPEDLIKLKRSNNRCHLVSRIPVFDANSKIIMYELKFTAGNVFQVNALKSEHVYHVLFGYFIRRGISCFVGKNKSAMVMMPLTYDLLNFIDRYSVNRVILRICPEQPVTPSALHLLTKLRRAGMSFAIELMLLLKKDWSKAILSIEYIMIDLSAKVNEQLQVFRRLKSKAPWLKTIGYNDTEGNGYSFLLRRQIDFYNSTYCTPGLSFSQDISYFIPEQDHALDLIKVLFEENIDYTVFKRFLQETSNLNRDLAIFLYRFRKASSRQVQNLEDLYNYLVSTSPNRSFSVLIVRNLMHIYAQSANIYSQTILQEYYTEILVRGYFIEYISKVMEDPYIDKYGFQTGVFSQLHLLMLEDEVNVLVDERYADIIDKIYSYEPIADIIECAKALETTDLATIFQFIQKYQLPPASVLNSYEKGIMRTNELLIALNIISKST